MVFAREKEREGGRESVSVWHWGERGEGDHIDEGGGEKRMEMVEVDETNLPPLKGGA